MPNKLRREALEWALGHVDLEGDTDLFPRPFEVDALKTAWQTLTAELENIDITNYRWHPARKFLLLKDEQSFRNVSQLDPLDALLFAVVAWEIGEHIERHRSPLLDETVFSYRFDPTPTGHLYGEEGHWNAFWQVSVHRAYQSNYVAVTDLTDFYNQISHHAIEHELDACGAAPHLKAAVKNLLKEFTQGTSRGIPIGPHPSHLLAELSLVPVDAVMKLKGHTFCRYSDDVHIFCGTREEAQVALFDLAETLDQQQRLSLNRHKTDILPSDEFLERATAKLTEAPINDEERAILDVVAARSTNPYAAVRLSDLTPEEVRAFTQERIESVFRAYFAQSYANVERIRWFLRRLAQVGSPGGVEIVVKNLNLLLPAIGDATRYLASARDTYSGQWSTIGADLLAAMKLPIVRRSEYLQIVLLGLFSRITPLDHLGGLIQDFRNVGPAAKRKIVLAAAESGTEAWLRGFKENYATLDPWLRRAVIFAAKTFSRDERRYWLGLVKGSASLLERAIIESIR